jgi:hypothetical protein
VFRESAECVSSVVNAFGAIHLVVREPRQHPRRRCRARSYTVEHGKATDLLRRRLLHPAENLATRAVALGSREGDPAAECERQSQGRRFGGYWLSFAGAYLSAATKCCTCAESRVGRRGRSPQLWG